MTTLTRQDLNFGQVVADVLSEFLEVAVHLILYVREVYPIGIFQKRKKYNVPVQMSCHPELNQYIQDTLHCVKPLLEKNDVEKVVVVILDKDFHYFLPMVSNTCLCRSVLEQLLRAFILKISVCDAVLDNNPPAYHFSCRLYLHRSGSHTGGCHTEHGKDPGDKGE
uniref:Mitotic arrest deficient 2 like 2 n=1 Tax=Accipiter nisus TaxID=211598 RepID=A0A8B9M3E3_9AVES